MEKEYKFCLGASFIIKAKNYKEACKKAEEYPINNLELMDLN